MSLLCQNCGAENNDTGGDPSHMKCGKCGRGPLVRKSNKGTDAGGLIGAVIGAALGVGIAGLAGALIGTLIGTIAGFDRDKEKR